MKSAKTLLAALAAATLAVPALADVHLSDAYARVSGPDARSGAAFMVIENHGHHDDRMIGAASDVAERVELHTHAEDSDGVMRMFEVEEGFAIPAGGSHALERGGDHVMFMGLNRSLAHGDTVTVTFTFEQAGEVTAEIPVDLERQPAGHGGGAAMMDHDHDDGHGNH